MVRLDEVAGTFAIKRLQSGNSLWFNEPMWGNLSLVLAIRGTASAAY